MLSTHSTQKLAQRGEGCPSLINSNLTLFLADVGLGFFPIHPSRPALLGLGAWITMVSDPLD